MNKIIVLTIFGLFLGLNTFAKARIPIPVCTPCENIEEVKDLPDDELLQESGEYLNLGYFYKEYGAVFIPAWNTDGRYVLINKDKTTYYDLTEEQLTEIKTAYNLDLSSNPLSFWKKIGGKLILLLIIGGIIFLKFSKSDDEITE